MFMLSLTLFQTRTICLKQDIDFQTLTPQNTLMNNTVMAHILFLSVTARALPSTTKTSELVIFRIHYFQYPTSDTKFVTTSDPTMDKSVY